MKKHFTSLSVIAAVTGLCFSLSLNAQTLYVPSGTGGIGSTSGSPNTNIGFGTSTPSNYLAGTNGLTLFGTYPGLAFATSTKTWLLYKQADNSFRLWEDSGVNVGDDRITVLPGGNLGVGVTNPSQILHVAKDGGTGGTQLLVQDLSTTYPGGIYVGSYQGNAYLQPSSAGKSITFWDNTAERMRILSGGNIGINNPSPSAKLQVTDGSVLFNSGASFPIGVTPISGAGTRMMWASAKAAFRAGLVSGSSWDDVNIGAFSFATGTDTKASAPGSFAAGSSTNASAFCSTVFGLQNTASGGYSFAGGSGNTASGTRSMAFGETTTASGMNATTFGSGTTALGTSSTALGYYTTAQSYSSLALGSWNVLGTYNATSWVATDPLFVIGNGTSPNATSNAVTVLKNGKVSIGVPLNLLTDIHHPGVYKLYVAGGIMTESCRVALQTDQNNWGDWVFDKNNRRMTFEEQSKYYDKNKHLKHIPSASKIKEEGGIDVADMLTGVVINLEETRLDNIALHTENQEQKAEIEEMKSQIKQMQLQIERLEKK